MIKQAMRRRTQLGVGTAVLALALTALGIGMTAGVSSAHFPDNYPTCSGFVYSFGAYDGPADNNRFILVVDGRTVIDQTFGGDLMDTFDWDRTKPHTYTYSLDANIDSGPADVYDIPPTSGTQEACTSIPPDSSSTSSTSSTSTTSTTSSLPPDSSTSSTSSSSSLPPDSSAPPSSITPTTAASVLPPTPTPPSDSSTTTSTVCAASSGVTPTSSGSTGTGPAGSTICTTGDGGSAAAADAPLAASGAVAPQAPVLAAPQGSQLPATGTNTGMQLTLAMAVVLAGIGLVVVARRRVHDSGA